MTQIVFIFEKINLPNTCGDNINKGESCPVKIAY